MIGKLNFFLELQIKQTRDVINQNMYIKDLLKRFGMVHVKEADTPIWTSKFNMDENVKNVDTIKYWGMIGSLLYVAAASRPDIMFCICLCARFQACPKESHITINKHIFRYLHGIINLDSIQNEASWVWLAIRMLILLSVRLIEKILVEHVIF